MPRERGATSLAQSCPLKPKLDPDVHHGSKAILDLRSMPGTSTTPGHGDVDRVEIRKKCRER
jgi:hypothetical protein